MTTLLISKDLDETVFRTLQSIWNSNQHVEFIFAKDISYTEINKIFKFLLSILPNSFAFSILENIADEYQIHMDLLEELLEFGDIGCNETICMRNDLSINVINKCKELTLHHLNGKHIK